MEKSNSLDERQMTPPLSIPQTQQQQRKAKRPSPLILSSPISIPNRRFSAESGIEDNDDQESNLSRSIGTQTPTQTPVEKKTFEFPSTSTSAAAGAGTSGIDITDGDMIPKRRSIGGGDGELEVLRNEFSLEKRYLFGGHSPTMSVFSMFAARYDSNFASNSTSTTCTTTTKEIVTSTSTEDDEGIEIGSQLRNIGDELDRIMFEQRSKFVERRRSTC